MPLDPFLVPLMEALPATDYSAIQDYPAFRRQTSEMVDALAAQLIEPGPAVGDVSDVVLPVDGGFIDLRVYRPAGNGPFPAHLYIHGGGWLVGDVHNVAVDAFCRERAVGASCVVVSVNYRKAPEHPFPTGLQDCYAALTWISDHAEELQVRSDLITVGGGSAGGNLAAGLTLKVRDEGGPAIAFQLLEVPALDLTLSLPSHQTYGTGYALNLADVQEMLRLYLPDAAAATNPYASPLHADELAGLPPAHIMSAEFDMLRDDGSLYAERLQQAGVPATFALHAGHVHPSVGFTKVMESARVWREEVLDTLRRVHAQHAPAHD